MLNKLFRSFIFELQLSSVQLNLNIEMTNYPERTSRSSLFSYPWPWKQWQPRSLTPSGRVGSEKRTSPETERLRRVGMPSGRFCYASSLVPCRPWRSAWRRRSCQLPMEQDVTDECMTVIGDIFQNKWKCQPITFIERFPSNQLRSSYDVDLHEPRQIVVRKTEKEFGFDLTPWPCRRDTDLLNRTAAHDALHRWRLESGGMNWSIF